MIQIKDQNTVIITDSILSSPGYLIPLIKALLLLVRCSDVSLMRQKDIDIVVTLIEDLMPEDSQIDMAKKPL